MSYLNKRIVSLESNHNMLEQYGRRNNIEITGIPDTVQDNELESKVTVIFDAIGVEANSADFEDCHRVRKSKKNSKKVIARFVNRKVVKNALYKRKQLRTIDKSSIGLQNATIFLNGTNIIWCNILENGKPQKVNHVNDLCVMFPDINFANDDNDYSGDPANESLRSSY